MTTDIAINAAIVEDEDLTPQPGIYGDGYPPVEFDFTSRMTQLTKAADDRRKLAELEHARYPLGRNVEGYLPMDEAKDIDWKSRYEKLMEGMYESDTSSDEEASDQ